MKIVKRKQVLRILTHFINDVIPETVDEEFLKFHT